MSDTDAPSGMLTGEALIRAIAEVEYLPPILVNHLLVEDATFMLCSDGGIGKSTFLVTAFAAMSAGLPVWGQLECREPLRVVLLLGERTWREPVRRLKKLQAVLPFNAANIYICDAFSGSVNLLMDADADRVTNAVVKVCPNPHVVGFDPLFPWVAGALSDDRTGNLLTRQLTRMKRVWRSVLWLSHHNVKLRTDDSGKITRPPLAYYGSVWLMNSVTTMFAAVRDGDGRTLLQNQKDNWNVNLPEMMLLYDQLTENVVIDPNMSPKSKAGKADQFLSERAISGKPFTRDEIISATGISAKHLYRFFTSPLWQGRISNSAANGQPALYKVAHL